MWEIQSPADLAFPSTGRRGGGGGRRGPLAAYFQGRKAVHGDVHPGGTVSPRHGSAAIRGLA